MRVSRHMSVYVLLALAAIFPLVVVLGITLSHSYRLEQDRLAQELTFKTRILVDDLDEQLNSQIALVKALAESPILDPPFDAERFGKWMTNIDRYNAFWLSARLFDSQGNLIFKIEGDQEAIIDQDSLGYAIETKRTIIGSVAKGPFGQWGVPIRTPVIRDGKLVYVLGIILRADLFYSAFHEANASLNTLEETDDRSGWTAVIADQKGNIVARSRDNKGSIGKQIGPNAFMQRDLHKGGMYEGHTLEGTQTIASFLHSSVANWSVHVSLSKRKYEEPLIAYRTTLVSGIALSFALAVIFIFLLYKEIMRRQQQLNSLEQTYRMESLGRLTGRVAHDINNLLMVMIGNVELLSNHIPSDIDPKYLKAIQRAIDRASKLMKDLLAFSRGRAAETETVVLNSHLDETLFSMQQAVPANVKIETNFEEVSPIDVDKVQLDMAMLNLLVNSADAMPNGGTICLRTWRERHGNEHFVCLVVEDTGFGIPKNIIKNVFEPFFTTKDHGTGFGLSQVYGFVRQSGGTIQLDSSPSGTTITMLFPAKTN